MKELEMEYSLRGFKLRQILNTGSSYLYEKISTEGTVTYEVFKRKENKLYNCVKYPTDRAFGSWAWAYWTKERAIQKLNEI